MLRFKQPLRQHSDGRLVPAGRAALAVQSPVFIVHTYEWQKGVDNSKKSYYGAVLKKTWLENTQGQARNTLFFHLLAVSLLSLYRSIQQSWEHTGVAELERARESEREREREREAMSP